jgi:hypothetical protein
MPIKINNTTVIDDSRNITNVANIAATGTITGNVTATGVISAASFSGSGTSLTGVATVGKAIAVAMVLGG